METVIIISYIFISIILYVPFKKLYLYIIDMKKEDYLVSDRNVMLFCTIFWAITLPIVLGIGIIEWNCKNKNKPAKW